MDATIAALTESLRPLGIPAGAIFIDFTAQTKVHAYKWEGSRPRETAQSRAHRSGTADSRSTSTASRGKRPPRAAEGRGRNHRSGIKATAIEATKAARGPCHKVWSHRADGAGEIWRITVRATAEAETRTIASRIVNRRRSAGRAGGPSSEVRGPTRTTGGWTSIRQGPLALTLGPNRAIIRVDVGRRGKSATA